jgi:chemotaxis response regulator CheB
VRIAIVNDLGLACEVLRRLVLSVPGYEVAWVAGNGEEAVARAAADPPDVILMDLVMPVLDGVEATRRIMHQRPCPILVTTSNVSGRFPMVCQAMGLGALDAFTTPVFGPDYQVQGGEDLLARLERLARSRLPSSHWKNPPSLVPGSFPLVALGSSTGGPEALAQILRGLPSGLPAGIVIVQHIDAEFASNLAWWLHNRTNWPVNLAQEGEEIRPGEVFVAGTNDHLVMRPDHRLGMTREPVALSYRPSVDVFFRSLVDGWRVPGVAVLLTGMGSDGAGGLAELRRAGWHTIAQDEATSVIYGMPRAAVELHAAVQVLPLAEIAGGIRMGLARTAAGSSGR